MKKTKILDAVISVVAAVIIILFVNILMFELFGIAGMGITEVLILAVPVFLAVLRKEKISERFNLKLPSIGSFFSAVLLMLGASMWENAASFIYVAVFGMPEQNDMVFLESFFSDVSPTVALIVIALIPAVCEELLFRGYVFDSFKGKRNKVFAVIASSLLFSLIHFDAYKTVPIFIMALAFGYITAKTDSVLIPMIFHFINNSMAVISFYATRGQDVQAVTAAVPDEIYLWYALAAFGGGLVFVWFGSGLLSRKSRKRWMNIAVTVIGIVLFVASVAGLIASMMGIPYMGDYSTKLREDTVYTESFVLEEEGVGFVTATVFCPEDVSYTVTVTAPDGEEIYNSDDPASGNGVSVGKGEYTVTYSFDVPEGDAVAKQVNASVVVITVDAAVTSEVSAV